MTAPTFTRDLLDGMASYLASAVGAWTYHANGIYVPGDTAIIIATMPDKPDRVVTLGPYTVSDAPSLSDSVQGIQLRYRAGPDPRDVADMTDAGFNALQGLQRQQWGAVTIVDCYRQSGAPMGADQAGRWEHADNYYLTVHRPSAHRA